MDVWQKLASAKWEDAWEERLAGFSPGRAVITRHPARKFLRIAVWDVTPAEARRLIRQFGGKVARVDAARAVARGIEAPPPANIRGRLVVSCSPADLAASRARHPRAEHLLVEPGLAFGTGAHPTTACCLRLLADLAADLPAGGWEMTDIGTGSGILAMAARHLGARAATAFDNDPAALRTAKASARANGIRGIAFSLQDATLWKPEKPAAAVAANLFHDLLVACAPRIAPAVAPGGSLILSGILREQEPAVLAAYRAEGFAPRAIPRRGKWVAALLSRTS